MIASCSNKFNLFLLIVKETWNWGTSKFKLPIGIAKECVWLWLTLILICNILKVKTGSIWCQFSYVTEKLEAQIDYRVLTANKISKALS